MTTWIAIDINGNQAIVSAFTESEARQKAEEQLGWGNIVQWRQI